MKRTIITIVLSGLLALTLDAQPAKWIGAADASDEVKNQWIAFRKDVNLREVPAEAFAEIATDSKYWLWINGELAVFEGQLKRGPRPGDSYMDKVDIAPYLRKGRNRIAVLQLYFGKSGFSHSSSGKPGLYFSAPAAGLYSDASWSARVHPAYGTKDGPEPNYRLPESNISFDARLDIGDWQKGKLQGFAPAKELASRDEGPWGRLEERPIPLFKDFGLKEINFTTTVENDTVTAVAALPYNMQMTPQLTISSRKAGEKVSIRTDHSFAGGTENVSAEYVTAKGTRTYESLGWMNGEKIILRYPSSVTLESLAYRESGYDTDPTGSFTCDDEFYNRFWQKALRTLYVNMRDTYFDCPDRERAQWWGDEVVLLGEAFYTYSPSINLLVRKGLRELVDWARPDGALHSPIPGNYEPELPGQMLAAIGRYGLWTYYMDTGDIETLRYCYPAVKKYLNLWTLDDTGLVNFRSGGWSWGDWGNDKDMRLIYAGWYIIALQSAADIALTLRLPEDAAYFSERAATVQAAYAKCWNGIAYRHPDHKKATDDRVQALAVLAGVATPDMYPAILEVFKTEEHASPYMEKYVMEALFKMGYGEFAMERAKKRFSLMVDDPEHTTLYEFWELMKHGKTSASTCNHAWSGGSLTVIARELCGIRPTAPGCSAVAIEPVDVRFKHYDISVPLPTGMLRSKWDKGESGRISWQIEVPEGTVAEVRLPWNGEMRFCKGGTYEFAGQAQNLD